MEAGQPKQSFPSSSAPRSACTLKREATDLVREGPEAQGAVERRWDKKKHLSDLLGRAVRTALQDLDDLLVVRGILRKADFQLPEELATLLKSLLLLKLPEQKEGKSGVTHVARAGLRGLSLRTQGNRPGPRGRRGPEDSGASVHDGQSVSGLQHLHPLGVPVTETCIISKYLLLHEPWNQT